MRTTRVLSTYRIAEGVEVPELSERLVWRAFGNLKKTATGPDEIPFWIWRDSPEIFTPVIYLSKQE